MGIFSFLSGTPGTIKSEIRNESDADVIIYKSDIVDFNINTHIQINPGECAIFLNTDSHGKTESYEMHEGQVVDTNNIPFFRLLSDRLHGDKSRYACSVCFVRLQEMANLLWGTPGQLGAFEDALHYTFKISANGIFSARIVNPKTLIEKVLGYGKTSYTKSELEELLRSQIQAEVCRLMSKVFSTPKYIGSITASLKSNLIETMQECIAKIINDEVSERWGIEIKQFKIQNITERDDELLDFQRKNNNTVQELQARVYQGTEYNTITMNQMLRNMSLTESNMMGNMMGAGIGIGVGGSIGQNLASTLTTPGLGGTSATGGIQAKDSVQGYGEWMEAPQDPAIVRKNKLKELKEYLDQGIINEETYKSNVQEILNQII